MLDDLAGDGNEMQTAKGKLVFLANVTVPLLCLALVRPVWVGRLAAVAVCLSFLTVVLLIYGFDPRSEFLHHKSKIARVGSDRTKRNARHIIRGLVIASGVFLLLMVDRPILWDCVCAARVGRSYISDVRGQVRTNQFLFGLYFVHQSLIIQGDERSDGYTAMFFPRLARVGKTYHFLIAPRSKIVLDWKVIE